jgi:hypothetical protein
VKIDYFSYLNASNYRGMKKEAITTDPGYFSRYINLVPDVDLAEALEASLEAVLALDVAALEEKGSYAYAPGKWTVKDLLQHIIDTERVFTYRALMFGRNDKQIIPGMDQDLFADNAETGHRTLKDLLDELISLRKATIALFYSFTPAALMRTGICWKWEMSVLGVGFIIAGHQIHHLNILREKYQF